MIWTRRIKNTCTNTKRKISIQLAERGNRKGRPWVKNDFNQSYQRHANYCFYKYLHHRNYINNDNDDNYNDNDDSNDNNNYNDENNIYDNNRWNKWPSLNTCESWWNIIWSDMQKNGSKLSLNWYFFEDVLFFLSNFPSSHLGNYDFMRRKGLSGYILLKNSSRIYQNIQFFW